MSVYSVGNNYTTGGFGSRWQPKQSRITVGRDVAPLTSTGFSANTANNNVLGHGDDVTLKSRRLFDYAMSNVQNGGRAQSFRGLAKLMDKSEDIELPVKANNVLAEQGDYSISYDAASKQINIFAKSAESGEFELTQSVAVTQDMKISWGEDGKPQVLTGAAAQSRGALEAKGENEIIIRTSNVDVIAGSGTTVLNLSSSAGTFSGGNKVTYLGTYLGSTFTDVKGDVDFAGHFAGSTFSKLTGTNTFSGVFENVEVDAAKGRNAFTGYFSASAIMGGKEAYTASGLFMNGSTVIGSTGDDTFSGRFIDSEVNGGEGDDSFGNSASIGNSETLVYKKHKDSIAYQGLAADFVNSTVSAGAGNDKFKGVMWGGSLDLEQGENTVRGVFGQTAVNGGTGNDDLTAMYSYSSSFNAGIGDDKVTLLTSVMSTVTTDKGDDKISMGQNNPQDGAATWQTSSEYFAKARPTETGELRENTVNAEKGENQIAIHNGESTVAALSGTEYMTYTRKIEHEEKESSKKEGSDTQDTPDAQEPISLLTDKQKANPQAKQYAVVSTLLDTPEVLNTDTSETDEENGPSERKMRRAQGRYKSVLGFEPLDKGNPAVTVNTSDGESQTFHGIARYNKFEGQGGGAAMVQTVRRAGPDGTYSWDYVPGTRVSV